MATNYKITVSDQFDNFGNPLLKLGDKKYETREEACEAVYSALIDRIDRFGCEMVEKAECADYGMLYACDSNGMNAVPLVPGEDPCSRTEIVERMSTLRDGTELREATAEDGCAPDVDFVSVNDEGEIVGCFQFVEADYADVCRVFIMKHGYAIYDGVTATVEEVEQ